ncbi:unnamed product [Ostreococcus tauri]|uniref:Unnamed product n=1 Tax=Ostreococcus tauri TaxID=70448 RepID=Q014J1_OSTTA|nr:unnamed product [Ostreococcus tauri]OUS47222.1 hypothetical protein BE221DRAFT_110965 [Ostreococcus tauri]CAL54688.1 unnamed product [Ostreococcus tauri]|eukprot:XP_003080521.1 unnamed product [Ostreococcus tauri]
MVAVFVLGAAAVGTVVINVKKNRGNGRRSRTGASMFDEEARNAASSARVAGLEDMLKDMADKARLAEERLESAMREKNAIERVLEEMERAKSNMRVENTELRDSVTVLKSDLQEVTERHQLVVRKWRDELVTYREKTPQDFLAEVIGLVADMDNEVTIEVIPPEAPREEKKHDEVRLEECEWEYNPRLAVADSTRLLMLANCGKFVAATKNERFQKVTHVKPIASPYRPTTPTRAALGKLTNTGAQRAAKVMQKATDLVHASRTASTPATKVIGTERSIEFGECLTFEKSVSSPIAKLVSPRGGVLTAVEADDFMTPTSNAISR